MTTGFDVLIIGGGIMGASLAYHLLNDGFDGKVAVFEKDPAYTYASTTLSAGGIRQQFSTEVNIRMSRYSLGFYETFDETMAVEGEKAHAEFRQAGYLFLSTEKSWPLFLKHHALQAALGTEVSLLSVEETLKVVPHLNTEGLAGASWSPRDGYLDPHGTLQGFVRKAKSLGARFIYDEVTAIRSDGHRVTGLRTKSGADYPAGVVVDAAGPWAAEVGRMAGLDLPVDPVRRMIFAFQPPDVFDYELPLVVDPTGLYFRGETGRIILTGKAIEAEPPGFNFRTDTAYFTDTLWPILAHRVPVFDRLKLIKGWAGLYEINRLDSNALLGEHPELAGFFMAVGFSGHGFMQAPAVGKALSEKIRLGRYETVDVSPLNCDRLSSGRRVVEEEVV